MLIKGHVRIKWLESQPCGASPVLGALENRVKYKMRYLCSRNPEARKTLPIPLRTQAIQLAPNTQEGLEGPKETSSDWQDAGLILLVSEQGGEHWAAEPAHL